MEGLALADSRRILSGAIPAAVLAMLVFGGMGISLLLISGQRELVDRVQTDKLCASITPVHVGAPQWQAKAFLTAGVWRSS
mgnify:CR=1 FL=1